MAIFAPYKPQKGVITIGKLNDIEQDSEPSSSSEAIPDAFIRAFEKESDQTTSDIKIPDAFIKAFEQDPVQNTVGLDMGGFIGFNSLPNQDSSGFPFQTLEQATSKFASGLSAAGSSVMEVSSDISDAGKDLFKMFTGTGEKKQEQPKTQEEFDKQIKSKNDAEFYGQLNQSIQEVRREEDTNRIFKPQDEAINKRLGNNLSFEGLREPNGELRTDVVINDEKAQKEEITAQDRQAAKASAFATATGDRSGLKYHQGAKEGNSIIGSSTNAGVG